MKPVSPEDSAQAMQRVRVGMTGLAMVLVMIGLASAIFTSASREDSVGGLANAAIVANMADGNIHAGTEPIVPTGELGVAPSTGSTETVNAAAIAEEQRKAQGQR